MDEVISLFRWTKHSCVTYKDLPLGFLFGGVNNRKRILKLEDGRKQILIPVLLGRFCVCCLSVALFRRSLTHLVLSVLIFVVSLSHYGFVC